MAKARQRPQRVAKAAKVGALRPMLLAAGFALYWFVEHQGGEADADAPMIGYVALQAVRLFVDFVGAWFTVSALQLIFALGRVGVTYLGASRPQENP
jgi:hypothetical protein